MRSGAQWELIPASYGNWNSIYNRYARWCGRGIFEQMQAHLADDPDCECLLLDNTIIRAHPCAAGAPVEASEKAEQALAPRGYPLTHRRHGFSC